MELIGVTAGLLTLITYIPQSVKTLKTRKTDDLSLTTYILLVMSAFLWVVYGLGSRLPAIWVTNSIVGGLGILILVLKLKSK